MHAIALGFDFLSLLEYWLLLDNKSNLKLAFKSRRYAIGKLNFFGIL